MDNELTKLIALAKIGITAVVDEATAFQDHRPTDALAKRYRELGGKDSDYRAPDYPPEEDA